MSNDTDRNGTPLPGVVMVKRVYVVRVCDDVNGRTWDVYNVVVDVTVANYATRKAAQTDAAQRNALEEAQFPPRVMREKASSFGYDGKNVLVYGERGAELVVSRADAYKLAMCCVAADPIFKLVPADMPVKRRMKK